MRDTAYNRWITDLHWIRSGEQTRSRRTQEKLLDAAEMLFVEHGVPATSVIDVATAAGCSVGAVYHHFSNKEALVYALFERLRGEFQAMSAEFLKADRWIGANVADILGAYIELWLYASQMRPALKLTGIGAVQSDDRIREDLIELQKGINRGLTALLMERAHEIGHPEPSEAIGFALDQIAAMTTLRQNRMPVASEISALPDQTFMEELQRSMFAYLILEAD